MRSLALLALSLAALAAAAARAADPADAWRRSYAAEARGEPAAALAALDDLGPSAPGYVVALRRGWLLHLAGREEAAAEAYGRAMALEPRAVEARVGALLPLMALRRWRDAERVAGEALALAPGDPLATARLAWIHYSQGAWAKAEPVYRRAVEAHPAAVDLRTGLGWTLLKLGRFKEARAELERVLAFAPDHGPAREGLSLVP